MTERKVRVALIGAGSLANQVHYPALTSLADVEIVGLCDLDAGRLARTAERFGIRYTCRDYRQMLEDTQPEAVYALMPPHVLFDVAMDILQRGHHLFIEKPPAVTTLQAEALAREAARQHLITGVGFQRRYHPLVRACWEEVTRKGPVHQAVACFYKSMPPQETHPYYRGAIDIARSDAIHVVDALRYYCGLSEVQAVSSEVRRLDCWYDVSFNSLVAFKNGSIGILLANWRTGKRTLKFEFHSLGASAFVDADGVGEVFADNAAEPVIRATASEYVASEEMHVVQGFLAENRAFIDAVKTGQPVHNNLEDAVKTMQLVDRIYNSAINR
ncbi:MAG: Gfo/Idh/MocA family oxidoreductase [Anaerolineales bacterium]|nr:Gfo/Idh/MocA family oxidoreductase [Anaerolineales bacterium]